MNNKRLKIGLFGFGCVGQGLYDVLHKTKGIQAEILKICVKNKNKERSLSAEYFTFEKDDILNNPEIDIVVELIDNADEAFEIVKTAIKNGKAVVSANKKMIAQNFEELYQLQQTYNVPVLYEAACCASIPVIRNLEEYYDNDLLKSLEGIINGTSNYILSKVVHENQSYGDALSHAQSLGYAETDPTSDVGGFDAKYKACILTAHAFGLFIKPENVFNYGIQTLSDFDLKFAREKDLRLKSVAHSHKVDENSVAVWVLPQFVKREETLFQVENENNGVVVEAVFSDKQFFMGKGAGAYPTGSAVLSDISALTYNYKYEYKKKFQGEKLTHSNEFFIKIYLRFIDKESLNLIKFENIEESYSSKDHKFVIGTIKFSELVNSPLIHQKDVFVARIDNSVITLNAN